MLIHCKDIIIRINELFVLFMCLFMFNHYNCINSLLIASLISLFISNAHVPFCPVAEPDFDLDVNIQNASDFSAKTGGGGLCDPSPIGS